MSILISETNSNHMKRIRDFVKEFTREIANEEVLEKCSIVEALSFLGPEKAVKPVFSFINRI